MLKGRTIEFHSITSNHLTDRFYDCIHGSFVINFMLITQIEQCMYMHSLIPTLQSLISRNYRGDVDMSVIDKFLPMVLDMEEEGNMSPILIQEKATFVYIKHNNLYCILPHRHAHVYYTCTNGNHF